MSVNIKNWQELKKPNSLEIKAGGDGKRRATFVAELVQRRRVHGVIGIGGGTATLVATSVMKRLPFKPAVVQEVVKAVSKGKGAEVNLKALAGGAAAA